MKKLAVLLVALTLLVPVAFASPVSAQAPPFVRIAGGDRIGTAIALSQAAWATPPVDAVVVARADAFPDALAAGPLARQLNAPILLTNSTELVPAVANEIRRLSPERIFLLGGQAALSQGVENALAALAPGVERLSGASRYATAEAIADRTSGNVAAVASGENFPDALSANSLAPSDILLTQRNLLSFDPRRLGPTTIVGGTAVIAPDLLVAPRLSGSNRYLTNLAILEEVLGRRSGEFQLFVATGENFPDALAAGSLTQPILLVNPAWTVLPAELEAFLTGNRARFNAVFIFGGTGAVPEDTANLLIDALGGPPDPGPEEPPAPPDNRAPSITAIDDRTSEVGDTVSLQVVATDPDEADDLSYSATGLPQGLSISGSTGLISGTITADPGDYDVTVTVSDGNDGSDQAQFVWIVAEVEPSNRPPTISAIPPQTNKEGDDVNLQVDADDPDGDDLDYSAEDLPNGLGINSATGLISGTIEAGAAGQYMPRVTVDDGNGVTEDEDFTWTVEAESGTATTPPESGTAGTSATADDGSGLFQRLWSGLFSMMTGVSKLLQVDAGVSGF